MGSKIKSFEKEIHKRYLSDRLQPYNIEDKFTLPIGIYDDHMKFLKMENNVLIYGDAGSGKTTILHNIITGAALLYDSDSVDIIVLDSSGVLEFNLQYYAIKYKNVQVYTSHKDCLRALNSVSWRIEEKDKSKRTLVVIDNVSKLLTDHKIYERLYQVISMNKDTGVHFVIAGTGKAQNSELLSFASETVLLALNANSPVFVKLSIPYVLLPDKKGYAVYVQNSTSKLSMDILHIPKPNFGKQQKYAWDLKKMEAYHE